MLNQHFVWLAELSVFGKNKKEMIMDHPEADSCVIFSSPRTGTHAVCRILDLIGLDKNDLVWPPTFAPEDIANSIQSLPKKGHYISGAHSDPNLLVREAFEQSGIKGILISRDLRDTVVSLAHFGRQGVPIKDKPMECRISEHIPIALFHHKRNAKWRDVENVYSTTYERIFQQTGVEILQIAKHVGIELTEEELKWCVENFPPDKGEQPNPMFFRKGIVGDWKNFFQPYHVFMIKFLAGDVLVEDGYEKDLNWEL